MGAQLSMQTAAVIGTQAVPVARSNLSIVTICTKQKRFKPSPAGTPAALTAATQADLAAQWIAVTQSLPRTTVAANLYAGRAFGLARDAAMVTAAPLFILSAGLGLVASDTPVPAYGLTVSRSGAESIWSKVIGPFDASRWFAALTKGPHAVGWDKVFSPGSGRVLIALTRPYAVMIAPTLASLPHDDLKRLRIFGAGLSTLLPPTVREAVAPYDDRLDTMMPGTRSDFAQRALLHFAQHIAVVARDQKGDAEAVKCALAPVRAPLRPTRRSGSDADILTLIKARLAPGASASRLLRQLRDEDYIACEQGRFTELFRQAKAEDCAS
ncbi:hypothetical protein Asru_0009_31 [Acidisphaera rubrifaciens HS-AP3]|uniref:Uncharacterized protein n=1 Tax=Acidisphaera rubrifaciens HS-AP3 TaxID=1231350 RepID=A0A0D6P3S1_9PROT|nr:hypothetical protein Asru_0009_31 [Acidisphaera rubrifaciens HS-AP3]